MGKLNNHLFISYSNSSGLHVICLDSLLNILWQKSIIMYNSYNFHSLIASNDGGCLLTGWYGYYSSIGAPMPLMAVKPDKN
ncbi:MAG: hypothetical protein SGJ00_00165 [bacterium]|nr:hypothetical protein [bacterium]